MSATDQSSRSQSVMSQFSYGKVWTHADSQYETHSTLTSKTEASSGFYEGSHPPKSMEHILETGFDLEEHMEFVTDSPLSTNNNQTQHYNNQTSPFTTNDNNNMADQGQGQGQGQGHSLANNEDIMTGDEEEDVDDCSNITEAGFTIILKSPEYLNYRTLIKGTAWGRCVLICVTTARVHYYLTLSFSLLYSQYVVLL